MGVVDGKIWEDWKGVGVRRRMGGGERSWDDKRERMCERCKKADSNVSYTIG